VLPTPKFSQINATANYKGEETRNTSGKPKFCFVFAAETISENTQKIAELK